MGCSFFCEEDVYKFINETEKLNFDAYHFMPNSTHILSFARTNKISNERMGDFTMTKFIKFGVINGIRQKKLIIVKLKDIWKITFANFV